MDKDLKFLILFFYYERGSTAVASLKSVSAQTYDNYHLAFIDDSEDPSRGRFLFCEFASNASYHHTKDTLEAKIARGGSMFGAKANEIMLASYADVVVTLCDDDCLTPWYLEELNKFYKANPSIMSSFCDVITYDPSVDNWEDKLKEPASDHFLNHNKNPHCGGNSKDSSQQSFRMQCVKDGVRWASPLTACLDYHMWNSLYAHHGNAHYNGIIGQVKAYWSKQLGSRGDTYGNTQ